MIVKNTIIFVHRFKKQLYLLFIIPIFFGIALKSLFYFGLPVPYISWSKIQLFLIPFVELLIILLATDIYDKATDFQKNNLKLLVPFLFSSINIIAIILLEDYYDVPELNQYTLVAFFLKLSLPSLIVFGIASIFFAVKYLNNNINYKHFINTIFYAEDPQDLDNRKKRNTIIVLLVFFIIGLGIRLYNLAGYPPYIDEYIHLNKALRLLNGEPWVLSKWDRAFLTVTFPVYLSYRFFGVSLFSARLVMVVLNMLSIFPLYTLGKKISRKFAYICVVVFTFTPWFIASSRTVRGYAIAPIFLYTIAVLLIDLLDWDNLKLKEYLIKNKYKIFILILLLVYLLFDRLSVIKINIASYAIFIVLASLKAYKQNPSIKKILSFFTISFLTLVMIIPRTSLYHRFIEGENLIYKTTTRHWSALIKNNFNQLYSPSYLGYVILILGSIYIIYVSFTKYSKGKFTILFCYSAFIITLLYISYFLSSPGIPPRTRYGVLMEYWYLFLVAMAIYSIIIGTQQIFKKPKTQFLVIVLLPLIFNVQGFDYAITYEGGGNNRITGEKHYLVEEAHKYISARLTEDDILLTDFIDSYDKLYGHYLFPKERFSLIRVKDKYGDPTTVRNLITSYNQGWVVASFNRSLNRLDLPDSDLILKDKEITYHGIFGEIRIWEWNTISP